MKDPHSDTLLFPREANEKCILMNNECDNWGQEVIASCGAVVKSNLTSAIKRNSVDQIWQ